MNGSRADLRAAGLAGAVALGLGLALAVAGCASTPRGTAPAPESGAYASVDAAGTVVRLELVGLGEVRAGRGEIGGRPVAVAALGDGSAVVAGGGAGVMVGRLEQSGGSLTLDAPLLEGGATLTRTGDAAPGGDGRFAGRFRDFDGRLELELRQWGGIVAGRGALGGRAVALAAVVDAGAGGTARGGLLLADGNAVEVELESTGGWLTVDGFAGRRELMRVD